MWAVTIIWHVLDLGHKFSALASGSLASESNLWLAGMSGLLVFYLVLAWIIAAWAFILTAPTCLLATLYCFRRFGVLKRWLIATAITSIALVVLTNFGLFQARIYEKNVPFNPDQVAEKAKSATLRDFDPSLPPTPLDQLSDEEITNAMLKAARAKCVAPVDPDIVKACARQHDIQNW